MGLVRMFFWIEITLIGDKYKTYYHVKAFLYVQFIILKLSSSEMKAFRIIYENND